MNAGEPRLRIALAIGSANRGGAEGQLVRLAGHLKERGHDVRVILLTQAGPLTSVLDDLGVPWRVMRPLGLPTSTGRNLAIFPRLAATLWSWRPDVMYSWLSGAVWPTFLVSRPLRRTARVAAFRGEVFPTRFGIGTRLFRSAVRGAHGVTINAPQLREHALSWGADSDRVHFVANGVEVPDCSADPELTPPTAVVVANFRWYKGHDLLADALARVTAPVHVRLVGEGDYLEPTRQRLADLGIADRVTFVGQPADVPVELQQAQFAIHPSRTEGLSNAILEELAAGLPVVATDVGGTGLLVESGTNGLLVAPDDAQALAQAITYMATEHGERVRMAQAARKRAWEFSWDACVTNTEEVLKDAVSRRRR